MGLLLWILLIIIIAISIGGWEYLGVLFTFGITVLTIYGIFYSIKNNRWKQISFLSKGSSKNAIKVLHSETDGKNTDTTTNIFNTEQNTEFLSAPDTDLIKSKIESSMPTQNPKTISVKGVFDEERKKIELGHSIQNILLAGITHNDQLAGDLSGVNFAITKLTESSYPFSWNKSVAAEIRGDILLIEEFLPSLEDFPEFFEIEYKNEHPISIIPNEKKIKTIWTDSIYKIVIRSLYELFSSPCLNSIKSISFNGIVQSLDLATGNVSEKCILSVIVHRADFETLDLTRVDARQCFKRFKGISAHDLATLTPIPPLMKLNKEDQRFSDSYEVISSIDSGENLAAMDWRDFENLIRELFEKEFSESGSEVKITRASKDGGVDAVIFDSDPIRGGKIIIQAKRYTNVVGVSAVRDLYGTVMNEGATKGILVTTSDYGADSYNFAKDKPLTLLNGANLLHLLGKHGCQAHINISDAKKILKTTQDE